MANRYMIRFSDLLVVKTMLIKIVMTTMSILIYVEGAAGLLFVPPGSSMASLAPE